MRLLCEVGNSRQKNNGAAARDHVKVANVLEREMDFVIHDWMEMVEKQGDLMHVSVSPDTVSGYFLRSCY